MSKFFGGLIFFLVAIFLVYLLNFTQTDLVAQTYFASDPTFQTPYIIAILEILHHPFEYFWVIPSWLIAGFLSGFIIRSWKGTIIVCLLTGLILSLTWIFFMSRYTPNYWNTFLSAYSTLDFLGQTIGTGIYLGLFATVPAVCSAFLIRPRKKTIEQAPIKNIETICPTCGTIFQSKPQFCYKCNSRIDVDVKKDK